MTSLSADRPSIDPNEDLFGHAPFAESLAKGICGYRGTDGLVLALYGSWGSGKSTALNYVKYYLEQQPEEHRPIFVNFNPWWFSGQENLAKAFLGQLQAEFGKNEKLKKLVSILGDFAESLGIIADAWVGTQGTFKGLLSVIAKACRRKPKDVPAIKEDISKVLRDAGKRVVIFIDDIDRLTPEEIRQLFTVVKALADFPNVIYLLTFDREVASQAIEQQTGLPGSSYLDKIIQVPCELPSIDRMGLQTMLFNRLDQVLGNFLKDHLEDSYWTKVFLDGIEPLIQVPRDISRLTNALSITYPAVRGEVNPVDFIAIEAIRVFLPDLYDIVRTNGERFSAPSFYSIVGTATPEINQEFHQEWKNKVPERLRSSIEALLGYIFPMSSNTQHETGSLRECRKKLHVCHSDVFPAYFQFSIPSRMVSRSEIVKCLDVARSSKKFSNFLIRAIESTHPDHRPTKVHALLDQLMDYVDKEIAEEHIPSVIKALFDVGDTLTGYNEKLGLFDMHVTATVASPICRLLKRVHLEQRACMLRSAIEFGKAIAVQACLVQQLDTDVSEVKETGRSELLASDDIEELKRVWLRKIKILSCEKTLLNNPELSRILYAWKQWGSKEDVRTWCEKATQSSEGLLNFLQRFFQYTRARAMEDRDSRYQPRFEPAKLEDYIDIANCAKRLQDMADKVEIPEKDQEAVRQYLKEYKMLQSGKNPDNHY